MSAFETQPSSSNPPSPASSGEEAPRLRVIHPDLQPMTPAALDAQSPSLFFAREEAPAFEMKFVLDEMLAREVEARLSPSLIVDPHTDPQQGNSYQVATLYCDTPQLEVYHRIGRYRRFKMRLRQYGSGGLLFLERKTKKGEKVRKRRSAIEREQLARFNSSEYEADWEGAWFHRHLVRNRLAPVCLIEYRRVAYYGTGSQGPLRLTFDREIRGGLNSAWSVDTPGCVEELLPQQVICEFKFRRSLPSLFESVMKDLNLTSGGGSKYRHCLRTLGVVQEGDSDA